jgi:hypothetical protein
VTDPSNVLTSDNIASLNAVLTKAERALVSMRSRGSNVPYFKAAVAEFDKQKSALEGRITAIKPGIGRTPRTDPKVNTLIKDLTAYGKRVEQESKKTETTTFQFGKVKVASRSALEAKIKGVLPELAKNCANGALTDAQDGDAKDASKFGTGLRHASAGKKGVKGKSCSLFFSREVKNGGLETIVTIHAVGGHTASGPASYEIHESFIPTLKKGAEVSL